MSAPAHILRWIAGKGLDKASGPLSRGANALRPDGLPGIGELLQMFNNGMISHTALAAALRMGNVLVYDSNLPGTLLTAAEEQALNNLWQNVLFMSRPVPTEEQLLVMANRNDWSQDILATFLKRHGWGSTEFMSALMDLKNEIPGSADLVRFAVRHVFEPDLIKYLGYDDELNPAFEYWHSKQGMGYKLPPITNNGVTIDDWTWAKAFWWSHWVLPSPTQGYEMLHRLRPKGPDDPVARDESGLIFTPDDMRLLLRANDYPKFWRDKLAAISFRPIGIRNLRTLFVTNVIDRYEVKRIFLDQGYSATNAELQTQMLEAQKAQEKATYPAKVVRRFAIDAYKTGIIDQNEATIQIHRSLLPTQTKLDEFDSLSPAGQLADAIADDEAQIQTLAALLEQNLYRSKAILASTKRRFLKGVFNEPRARNTLAIGGFTPEAINFYINQWQLEFDQPKRELATNQVLHLLRYKLIPTDQAVSRLQNIGWPTDDINFLLLDVIREQALDTAKIQAAQARTVQEQQRAAQAIIKAADMAKRRAIADLMRHGNPAQLKRWATDNVISLNTFARRMSLIGWPVEDINNEIAEIQIAQAKAAAAAASKVVTAAGRRIKLPPVATLQKWLKKDIITEAEFTARALAWGVQPDAIQDYITEVKPK